MTTIEITEEEKDIFLKFREYQNIWEGLFRKPIKSTKVILHFDGDGTLRKAEIPNIIENK